MGQLAGETGGITGKEAVLHDLIFRYVSVWHCRCGRTSWAYRPPPSAVEPVPKLPLLRGSTGANKRQHRQKRLALQSLQKAGNQVAAMATEIDRTAQRLNAPEGAIDQASRSAQSLAQAVDRFGATTLPRMERAADETSRAARMVKRAAAGVSDNPQGFLYGPGREQPGPGETGFTPPPPAGQ